MLGLDLDPLVTHQLLVSAPLLAGQHFGGVFMIAQSDLGVRMTEEFSIA